MPLPPPVDLGPPKTPQEIEADDLRIRRSNLGGDDLITKVVFFVILIAAGVWIAHAWMVSHTMVPHV
ncbi:MAG TPA: hypothetical protein VGX96_13025 [Candidatus Elarobacter sp.]|nr:hypothetical protein [Candidatus Elarobacter sp.]